MATNTVMTDEANELDAGVEILVEEVSIDGLCGVY
ncbi:MAG TPA: mycofactocin precursor MftA [Acidimicrobiales bacterium]